MPCLVKEDSKRFLDAIRKGVITPERMLKATSKERQAILGRVVGPENAQWVNAALEAKILLKDQKRGMVTWAKKTAGLAPEVKRDLLSAVQKHDRVFDPKTGDAFLESLAEKKFGTAITFNEAKNVSNLAAAEQAAKAKIKETEPSGSKNRVDHAEALVTFQEYVDGLKQRAERVGDTIPQKALWYLKHPLQSLYRSAGAAKSALSTLDNSFFGRQGLKVLGTNPDIWGKAFLKSWVDIGKTLAGRDPMHAIKVDIHSHRNATNGKYKAGKYDLGIGPEEAFPSQFWSRIPGLGRIPRAAENAFNGGALRMRSKLADRYIARAERQGVDTLDPAQAEPIGKLINSMTGRGFTGKGDVAAKHLNVLIFSMKFLKSNFDTLTAHSLQKGVTPFVRRQAAANLLTLTGELAGLYWIANKLNPGSVELDPRSAAFGKIKIGNTHFDPTGGMASLATLASRLIPTMHNGKLGWYSKNRKGEVYELGTGKYGVKDAMDVFLDFWEGKFAPYAALLRNMVHGEDYQGRKTYMAEEDLPEFAKFANRVIPTPRTIYQAHAPIPLQNFEETMNNPNAAPLLMTTILDGLGIGASTYTPKETKPKAGKNGDDISRRMRKRAVRPSVR